MRILVTGGAGFVGSNLCARLMEDENNEVWCLDNLTRASYDVVNQLLKLSIEHSNDNDISIVPYYEDLFEHAMYLPQSQREEPGQCSGCG